MTQTNPSAYHILLVSTYELGRQPFGLASPAAWLGRTGASVRCLDLSREPFREADFKEADFVGFYIHMHTATRLAAEVIPRVTRLNPRAHLCAYGLYAPMNDGFLKSIGVQSVIGGEFEQDLVELATSLMAGRVLAEPISTVSTRKQQFLVPDRRLLPPLGGYSTLTMPDGTRRVAGYTEASRGCKHTCRHCPIVPVYNGKFRVVQREVVQDDIRQQVACGARHITFGDPDFFNGIGHAIAVVNALHDEFPDVTYDVTIKIEHLIQQADHIVTLKQTGCVFITSAVESVDDNILRILDKRHTRSDFIRALELCRASELPLAPTFVSFTPWITLQGYDEMLQLMADLQVVDWIAPVQWAIRLLIPQGSLLLQLPEIGRVLDGFNAAALSYRWRHPDPRMDELQGKIEGLVRQGGKAGLNRAGIYRSIRRVVSEQRGDHGVTTEEVPSGTAGCTIPYFSEPWYCCAEPTSEQLASL